MKRALATFLTVFSIAAAPASAWAASANAADEALSAYLAPVVMQRKDVQEVSLPPLPTGPATPPSYCSPSSPEC